VLENVLSAEFLSEFQRKLGVFVVLVDGGFDFFFAELTEGAAEGFEVGGKEGVEF